jgi:putative transposase
MRPDGNVELRQWTSVLAQRHKRNGVGMIHLKLSAGGLLVNHKPMEQLYREATLQVRRRKRKKVPVTERQPLARPTIANEVWSMDFVFDRRTVEGRVLKCLTVVEDTTHEVLVIEVERALFGVGMTRVMD